MRCSWSLDPSPRKATVVWPRTDAPTARRARSNVATPLFPSNQSIVLLLFAVVDNVTSSESMTFFRFGNLMTQVVGVSRSKSDDFGHRILTSKKIRSDFAYFGLHKQGHLCLRSKNTGSLKLEIEPHRKRTRRVEIDVDHSLPETCAGTVFFS